MATDQPCHGVFAGMRNRLLAELAGPQRSREVQVGLQAEADLYSGVTRTQHALTFAPNGERGNTLAEERVEPFNNLVIKAYQTKPPPVGEKIGSQIMQTRQSLVMVW